VAEDQSSGIFTHDQGALAEHAVPTERLPEAPHVNASPIVTPPGCGITMMQRIPVPFRHLLKGCRGGFGPAQTAGGEVPPLSLAPLTNSCEHGAPESASRERAP
jgi:hypothetical protein